jgi:hypothetical protein
MFRGERVIRYEFFCLDCAEVVGDCEAACIHGLTRDHMVILN